MVRVAWIAAAARSAAGASALLVLAACSRDAQPSDDRGAVPQPGDRAAARPHYDAAAAAMARGDEGSALTEVDRALELDPAHAPARVLRAVLRARPGPRLDPGVAAADLAAARALGVDPETVGTFEGLVRFQLGDAAAAQPLLEAAWARPAAETDETTRADVALALGELDFRRGDLDAAQRWFVKSRALLPGHPAPCEALARVALERGDAAEEERWLDAAIAVQPRSVAARCARAQLYARTGRVEEAAREREIHAILRQFGDDESAGFAQDHARRAALWQRLAELLPGDESVRLDAARERAQAPRPPAAGDRP